MPSASDSRLGSLSRQVLMALITVQVLFGLNYVVSKYIVSNFAPLPWASLRAAMTALILFPIALIARPDRRPTDKGFYGLLVGFSLLGIVINQGSFLAGLRYTTATNSAILNTLIPIFTLGFVTLFGHERFTRARGFGFALSLAGVLSLRHFEDFSLSDRTVLGDMLTIINCMSYGLFLSLSKGFLERYDPLWVTTWLFGYGAVGLLVLAAPDWRHITLPHFSPTLVAAMAFSVLGASLATYFLNLWALKRASSSSVALFIYLQPVVASTLAWATLGEVVTPRTIVSSLLIFVGVLIALAPPRGPEQRRAAA